MPPTPEPAPVRRTPLSVAAWAYYAGYTLWALAMLAGLVPRGLANDLLFFPLYVMAGYAGLRAARQHGGRPRFARGWRLVGLAWITSGLGAMLYVWAWEWPSPTMDWVATATYQLYFPLILLGLWHLTDLPPGRAARLRLAADGLIVVAAMVVLAWYFIFRMDEAYLKLGPLLKMLLVMFPGEMAVALAATAVVHGSTDGQRSRTLSLLSVGTLAAAVADFIYAHTDLTGSATSGALGDLVLALAAILVVSAGLAASAGEKRDQDRAVSIGLTLAPYLAIAVVAMLAIIQWWSANPTHSALPGLVLGGAILMGLLILRLNLAQREVASGARAREVQDARFRALVQQSMDAVLIVDRRGRIQYASPPFSAMVGSPSEDLTGRLLQELVTLEAPGELAQWLDHPAHGPIVRGKTANGREIEAAATDLTDEAVIGGIVINARDITDRSLLEAQLRQAQKLEAVGQFAASVAHDFNNVLTVISANLHFAKSAESEAPSEELRQIEAATERGAVLARQLMSLSRPRVATTAAVDLVAVTRATEKILRLLLPSSIQATIQAPAESLIVRLDEVRAEQILLNLAINARDAMPQGGRLHILIGASIDSGGARHARIVVSDTGCGMSREVLDNAFEPFFTTKGQARGTGLGLSSVRQIARDAGGNATIDSEPGRGTTVTIDLPLVHSPVASPPQAVPPAVATGRGRILVVDDEPAVRRIVARFLERLGYEVVEKGDGLAALDQLEANSESTDLVLTDLVMPRMGGEALARTIATRWPKLRVVCMSGTPSACGSGREPWSSDQVIAKPAELSIIADRIAEELRHRETATHS